MLNNPSITIIGAGKIAHSLLPSLINNRFEVKQIISKSISSAKKLARKYNIVSFSDSISEIDEKSYIYILSVPDSEIYYTALQLAKSKIDFNKKLVIHLSGSLTIDELLPLQKKGAYSASVHIMQTFPDKKITGLKEAYCAIESNDKKVLLFLKKLARKLEMKPLVISSDSKVFYHLAGVFASNFINANFFASAQAFDKINSENNLYLEVLGKTSATTLQNILSKGYSEALSGPVERGDFSTIEKHINALKKNRSKKLILDFYKSGSLLLLEVAREKGTISKKKYKEIKKLLLLK